MGQDLSRIHRNNDSYEGDYLLAPNSPFPSDTAELFSTNSLKGKADHQAFLETYKAGGYYVAEPLGINMEVIGLNTVFMSTEAESGLDSAIQTELTWLESTLAAARVAGKKVWVLLHVPPGADIYSSQSLLDGNGQLASATMLMQPTYQASLMQLISHYSDIITPTLAGHTHMENIRLTGITISPGTMPQVPSPIRTGPFTGAASGKWCSRLLPIV